MIDRSRTFAAVRKSRRTQARTSRCRRRLCIYVHLVTYLLQRLLRVPRRLRQRSAVHRPRSAERRARTALFLHSRLSMLTVSRIILFRISQLHKTVPYFLCPYFPTRLL